MKDVALSLRFDKPTKMWQLYTIYYEQDPKIKGKSFMVSSLKVEEFESLLLAEEAYKIKTQEEIFDRITNSIYQGS